MKAVIFFSFVVFFSSCAKEEKCQYYSLITESNEENARDKCQGLANNYPAFEVLTMVLLGCLTSDELNAAKKSESSVTKNACNGVPFTVKVTVK
jgi:hypothetical protein